MNGGSYLALQAWFTTLFTSGVNLLLGYAPYLESVKPLSPGIAVALSHVCILGIAAIGIPTINDIRLKKEIKAARAEIQSCLSQAGISEDVRKGYESQLVDLNAELLKKHSIRIVAIQEEIRKEASGE